MLVVDDQRPFRLAAAAVVRRTAGFVLVGEAASGAEAVAAAGELAPDLVLMDVNLPGELDGVGAAARIVARDPAAVIVLCSTYDRADLPSSVAASGCPYLHKADLGSAELRGLWHRFGLPSA